MHQFNKILVMVLVPFYMTHGANVPVEDTTDAMVDVYDPMGSDETYDPQKDYADFKSSYEKLYKMSGPPGFMSPPSMQQKQWQPIEEIEPEGDETTNPSNDDASDITTTITPQTEQQTTVRLFAENVVMRSMNDIVKSTQRPVTLATYEQSPPNAELLMRKSALTFDPMSSDNNKSDEDLINETGNTAQQAPVVFMPNESNIHNESVDYVNDEAIETNYSQPITSVPYSMDTTITSLPSSPVFISTRSPNGPFSTSTLISPVTMTDDISIAPPPPPEPLAGVQSITPNQSVGKKSKKIEALPRVYKYSADEIVRKYLDDTFLRAPLATLINTAPEPLRKSKILWKSALRPNTPIDIVLVAFNSSGKIMIDINKTNNYCQ